MLVGDTGSIKKGKEIINDLLNLDPPSSSATSASAQSKNHRKSPPSKTESASKTRTLKGKFPVITKKLPPLPAEPKPVGQVSRFSLLLAGNDPDSEESEQEVSKRPMKKTQPPKLPHTQIVHVPPPLPAPQPVPSTTTKTKNSKKSKKKKKSERTNSMCSQSSTATCGSTSSAKTTSTNLTIASTISASLSENHTGNKKSKRKNSTSEKKKETSESIDSTLIPPSLTNQNSFPALEQLADTQKMDNAVSKSNLVTQNSMEPLDPNFLETASCLPLGLTLEE